MLERSGVSTGLNLERLIEASEWLSVNMGRELPGMVSRAGNFPGVVGARAKARPNSA
jgi:hydroxymethylglutaryl-CoA lyase